MPKLSDVIGGSAAELPTEENLRKNALNRIAPDYAMLFFDHLYSEYLALKAHIKDQETRDLLEALNDKRLKCALTWSDIYSFDLTLVQARPLENLIRKAYDARAKYRSIAGQKEYDEYVASKPPNLPEIHIDPNADPPQPEVIIERALRADLEYLLSKVYLYYAILPVREHMRDWLTNRAVLITLAAVIVGGLLISVNVLLNLFDSQYFEKVSVVFITVLTVALAGIVGGCVSMLQRIQSAPSEGDALFNLAALENGWGGIFLSPLYGGIFACVLFVLFAAGLLEGSAFPSINTPRRQLVAQTQVKPPTPEVSSPSLSPPSPLPGATPLASPATAGSASTAPADTQPANSTATEDASARQTAQERPPSSAPISYYAPGVRQDIKEFLTHTGPVDGRSYALLIIWSFIAGFAERLVPDTLNRLVTKNESLSGR